MIAFHKTLPQPHWLIFATIFALFFTLGLLFPYTGDDWTWGSNVGMERLEADFFAGYNGRYLGNLLVLVLTRFVFLRALCIAFTLTGIIYGIYSFINKENKTLIWLALVFILFMPQQFRAQGIAWASGFSNYMVPLLGALAYLNSFRSVFDEEYSGLNISVWRKVELLILGVGLCLFMETVTLFVLFASVALLLYCRLRHAIWDKAQIVFLVGTLVGSVIMFSNEAYFVALTDPHAFHSIAKENLLYNIAFTFAAKIGYQNYVFCYACTLALALALVYATYRQKTSTGQVARWLVVCSSIATCLALYTLARTFINSSDESFARVIDVFAYLAFLSVSLTYAHIERKQHANLLPLFLIACSLALLAPLLVVSPVTWRCFIPPYIFLCLFVCEVWSKHIPPAPRVNQALAVLSVAGFILWFVVYGAIYGVYSQRETIIEQQLAAGASTIYLERLPFEEFIQHNDKVVESNAYNMRERFYNYYHIPENVELVFSEGASV